MWLLNCMPPPPAPRQFSLSLTLGNAIEPEPLLEVLPGALPLLELLFVSLVSQRQPIVVPPSWGASPQALPSLQRLVLEVPALGPLPAAWAVGFPQLAALSMVGDSNSGGAMAAAGHTAAAAAEGPTATSTRCSTAPAGRSPLPPEWGRGFPQLASLTLRRVGLTGGIPDAWQAPGSFPRLVNL